MSGTTKSVDDALYQKITDICFENGGVTKPMVDRLYALFATKLQEAEIRARLDEVQRTKGIESEVGKLANHSLRVQVHLEARIAELTKGGRDESSSGL